MCKRVQYAPLKCKQIVNYTHTVNAYIFIEFPFLSITFFLFQFPCNEIEWTGHAYRRIWPIAK